MSWIDKIGQEWITDLAGRFETVGIRVDDPQLDRSIGDSECASRRSDKPRMAPPEATITGGSDPRFNEVPAGAKFPIPSA
jgi:hypothetical protein